MLFRYTSSLAKESVVFPLCLLLWLVRWVGEFATNDKLAIVAKLTIGKGFGVNFERTRSTQITFAARGDFSAHAKQVTEGNFSTKIGSSDFNTTRRQDLDEIGNRLDNEPSFCK